MKNTLRLFTVAASVAAMAFVSSCGKKDDATPSTNATVTVASVNGNATVNGKTVSVEYADGDTLRVRFTKGGSNLLRSVKGFSSTTVGAESPTQVGDTTFTILTSGITSGSTWKLKVRSTSGGADSAIVTLNRTLSRYEATILTAPLIDNTSKTFITLTTGATWTILQATNSPAAVDLGFAVGNTVGGILMSPDNWFTGTTEPYAAEVGAWSNRKSTQIWLSSGAKISDYLTASDLASAFNAGTAGASTNTSYVLSGAANAGISSRVNSRVGNLTQGSTLVFKTAEGKHGIMVINSVVTGTGRTGQVNITYKVQQ